MLGLYYFVKAGWGRDLRLIGSSIHWLIMGKVMLLYLKNQDSYIVCTQGQTFSENDRNFLALMGGLPT